MALGRTKTKVIAALSTLALALAAGAYSAGYLPGRLPFGPGLKAAIAATDTGSRPADAANRASGDEHRADSLELTEKQRQTVQVEAVQERAFPVEKQSVGSIDFNQNMTLQVFTPYQGRIIRLFAEVGDDVKKGQTLFTIDSPDLLQAESTLIAAAGVLELTTRNLARLKELYQSRAVSQKDLEQAVSDQQTAEGNLRAARDAVRIFGKPDADIDGIVARRLADPTLIVPSPIDGRITARNAAPGLFVQPGGTPAPYSVADVTTMWMLANVAESDSPALHLGQEVKVSVAAFPGKVFEGRISTIGSMVDPNTRRVLVRSDIADPQHELRAGMFANFVIRTGDPLRSPGVPLAGVVREGDGTMTVWVTTDRRRFTKRTVKIGLENNGYRQILEGLQPGELVAADGAIFLSNMLATAKPQ
jgi:membrane fusion protein, heavy metal efflux system